MYLIGYKIFLQCLKISSKRVFKISEGLKIRYYLIFNFQPTRNNLRQNILKYFVNELFPQRNFSYTKL